MPFDAPDVSPEVAQRQAQRYRQMTPAEKLSCADAIYDLAWDAVKAGERLKHPELDDVTVTQLARARMRRAAIPRTAMARATD